MAAATCRGCALHCPATQTVFGEGPIDAPLMLVGEQPGDYEDRSGKVFVGPAGQVLDDILADAGIDRRLLYITNAVKHFKFTQSDTHRTHRTPNPAEINACKPWLKAEISLVKPKTIVTLGLSAARSLVHQGFSLKHDGDKPHRFNDISLLATWHPSAVLRTPEAAMKKQITQHIRNTILQGWTNVAALS